MERQSNEESEQAMEGVIEREKEKEAQESPH